jgi:hypothetical protein
MKRNTPQHPVSFQPQYSSSTADKGAKLTPPIFDRGRLGRGKAECKAEIKGEIIASSSWNFLQLQEF